MTWEQQRQLNLVWIEAATRYQAAVKAGRFKDVGELFKAMQSAAQAARDAFQEPKQG